MLDNTASAPKEAREIPSEMPQASSECKMAVTIPDTDILKKAECLSIEAMVVRNRLRWAGHVVRMEDVRLPKQLFYGEFKTGKRP